MRRGKALAFGLAMTGLLQRVWAVVLIESALLCAVQAAEWPAFRGPDGQGVAGDMKAPTVWSTDANIVWKTPLPRPGNGSPIVVGARLLVTSAEEANGRQRSLYAFDAHSGQRLWVRTESIERTMPTHKTNPYCGTTPASDGKRVVVWRTHFASVAKAT